MSKKMQNFNPPKWASKGPSGSFLSVIKDNELVEKLSLDQNEYYVFGRVYGDILILHESCSGLQAVLTYHKELSRWFIMDFGSTHGTFIGATRLEPNVFIPIDFESGIRFAFSTRKYFVRLFDMDPLPPKPKIMLPEPLPDETQENDNKNITNDKDDNKEIKLLNRKKKNKKYIKKKNNAQPEYFDSSLVPGDFTGRFEYTGNTYVLESSESFNNRQLMKKIASKKKKFDERPPKIKRKSLGVTTESAISKDPNSTVKLSFFKNIRF